MKFHTVLELGGKTATGIEVPAEVVDAFLSVVDRLESAAVEGPDVAALGVDAPSARIESHRSA